MAECVKRHREEVSTEKCLSVRESEISVFRMFSYI